MVGESEGRGGGAREERGEALLLDRLDGAKLNSAERQISFSRSALRKTSRVLPL
jgi:hypothetical protein